MSRHARTMTSISALIFALLLCLGSPAALTMAQEKGGELQATPAAASTITGSPLSISVLSDLSMIVKYNGATQFFADTAGGTFVQVDNTVYGSDPPASGNFAPLPYTAVSNSAVSGDGTQANPFKIVTVAQAGNTGVRVTQTTSYVNGESSYLVDVSLANTGSASHAIRIYHGADLYLNFPGNISDLGYGIYDESTGAVGALSEDHRSVQVFIPVTHADAFQEAIYSTFWATMGGANGSSGPGYNNTINETFHDIAAGLQYNRTLAAGATTSVSCIGAFGLASDLGITPTPPTTDNTDRPPSKANVSVVLRPEPTAVATTDSIIAVTVAVANHASGRSNTTTVTLPFDPAELSVLDASFSRPGAWVSSAISNALTIEMGTLGGDSSGTTDVVTGTVRFRVLPTAADGALLFDRATVRWHDNSGSGEHISNQPLTIVGPALSTSALYNLEVSPASEQAGATFTFDSVLFAPDEPVGVWYNLPDGTVAGEPTYRADSEGRLTIDLDSTDLPAGTYSLVYYGHWTEFTAVATFTIR
ncbi:MAG: hypothetical protein HGA45_00035 [Chloroflexales bacterium]|nr:hypothetical protein [Chloroflexales bacterium]